MNRFLINGVLASAIFAGGMYAARALAGAGTAVEAAERSLTFSGIMRQDGKPSSDTQSLTFTFKGPGAPCIAPPVTATPDANGRFQVDIPISACAQVFDGSAIKVDIAASGNLISKDVPLSAVPYAMHADQLGVSDCPSGYAREAVAEHILCQNGRDEVVRVGVGASAFWIDRFEASAWDDPEGQHAQYVTGYPATFPITGQASPHASLNAVSENGVLPSTGLTWFQMSRACRNVGKRLPTNEEWLEAANSTPTSTGDCNTTTNQERSTGLAKSCVSVWGAEDMVGNVGELTSEWSIDSGGPADHFWQGTPFTGGLWNVLSTSWAGRTEPLAVAHGGTFYDGSKASVFALSLTGSVTEPAHGFRCVIPR